MVEPSSISGPRRATGRSGQWFARPVPGGTGGTGGTVGILRLAHVDVRTPDLELSTAYYTEVLGLRLAGRGEDTVYLTCWDEENHHPVRLRYDPPARLDPFS